MSAPYINVSCIWVGVGKSRGNTKALSRQRGSSSRSNGSQELPPRGEPKDIYMDGNGIFTACHLLSF